MLNHSQKITASLLSALILGVGGFELWDASQNPAAVPPQKPTAARALENHSSALPSADESLTAIQAPVASDTNADQVDVTQALEEMPDPDLSSESLIGFAHQLSGLMERAMSSEKEALPAYAQLEQCAQNSDGNEVLQARLICFANASRLSKEFPSLLGTRFRALSEHNPKLAGLLETTGLE
jgi:hypothetical protein